MLFSKFYALASSVQAPVAGWDLKTMLTNTQNYGKTIGALIIGLFGIILIIWAVWLIFRAITGQPGTTGARWLGAVLGLIFGGGMLFGSWSLFSSIANGGQTTIKALGTGGFLILHSLGIY